MGFSLIILGYHIAAQLREHRHGGHRVRPGHDQVCTSTQTRSRSSRAPGVEGSGFVLEDDYMTVREEMVRRRSAWQRPARVYSGVLRRYVT